MTPSVPRSPDQESSSSRIDPGERRIPAERFAGLWLAEVPKVVARHEAELRGIREALGLA